MVLFADICNREKCVNTQKIKLGTSAVAEQPLQGVDAFYAIVVGGGVVVEGEQVFGVLVFNRLQRG